MVQAAGSAPNLEEKPPPVKTPGFPAHEAQRQQTLEFLNPLETAMGEWFERVTRLADAGLYRAKETGRDRVIPPIENGG